VQLRRNGQLSAGTQLIKFCSVRRQLCVTEDEAPPAGFRSLRLGLFGGEQVIHGHKFLAERCEVHRFRKRNSAVLFLQLQLLPEITASTKTGKSAVGLPIHMWHLKKALPLGAPKGEWVATCVA
jgi:hypothetical protein